MIPHFFCAQPLRKLPSKPSYLIDRFDALDEKDYFIVGWISNDGNKFLEVLDRFCQFLFH